MGRAEGTLFQARDALAADQLNWVDIAATMGFSDQAHLSREFRRITGLSPRELNAWFGLLRWCISANHALTPA